MLKKNPHYSGVLTTKKNIVVDFQEKITKKDNKKHKLNSGIYILKSSLIHEIKEKKFFDFANDVIPYFIKTKKKILSFNVGKVLTFDNKYLFNKNKKL